MLTLGWSLILQMSELHFPHGLRWNPNIPYPKCLASEMFWVVDFGIFAFTEQGILGI
jgi:hypothetical protein